MTKQLLEQSLEELLKQIKDLKKVADKKDRTQLIAAVDDAEKMLEAVRYQEARDAEEAGDKDLVSGTATEIASMGSHLEVLQEQSERDCPDWKKITGEIESLELKAQSLLKK